MIKMSNICYYPLICAIWRGVEDSRQIGSDGCYYYRVPKHDKLHLQQLGIINQEPESILRCQYYPDLRRYGSRHFSVYQFDIHRAEVCLDRMKGLEKDSKRRISPEDFESLCKN